MAIYEVGATVLDATHSRLGVIMRIMDYATGAVEVRGWDVMAADYVEYVATIDTLKLTEHYRAIREAVPDVITHESYWQIAQDLALMTGDKEWLMELAAVKKWQVESEGAE